MRRRILLAFESAEYEGSEEARRAALTFGIVGGGPTGVELAGAIKEIAGLRGLTCRHAPGSGPGSWRRLSCRQ
jgi:NADH dehydrogenase FAD-containing subunit